MALLERFPAVQGTSLDRSTLPYGFGSVFFMSSHEVYPSVAREKVGTETTAKIQTRLGVRENLLT